MSLPGSSLLQQLRRVLAGAGLGFRAWSFRFLALAFTGVLRFRIWGKELQEFGFSGLDLRVSRSTKIRSGMDWKVKGRNTREL